jgi:two-component system sensor histidine kinase BaeS
VRSLALKLVVAFFVVSLSGIALVALLASRVATNEFGAFAERQSRDLLVNQLESYYNMNHSWAGISQEMRPFNPYDPGQLRGPAVVDASGVVVLAGGGLPDGAHVPASVLALATPVAVKGVDVGYLIPFPSGPGRPPPGNEFVDRIRRNLGIAAIGAAALSLILGILLARTLSRPIRQLTEAAQRIADGQLDQHVHIRAHDEIGRLAEAFNRMSDELTRSLHLRQQMTADIAHELRTPLGVILGHAEALSDGVIPASPETFDVIHEEARRLARQVEDLRTLSLSDAGELSMQPLPIDAGMILGKSLKAHAAEAAAARIELKLEAATALPAISVDPDRLTQVLDNLLVNALRHTPEHGQVTLGASEIGGSVRISVSDTGPGVSQDDLGRIFDRYYRVDPARERQNGGSGLGLAIARSLVEAQGGRIWAEGGPGGGLVVMIEFPRTPAADS